MKLFSLFVYSHVYNQWWELISLFCLLPAPYFIDCISEADLDEMNIEIIRNTLYKVC